MIRRIVISLGMGSVAAWSVAVLVASPDAGAASPKPNYLCQQRQVCNVTSPGECQQSTTDCGNHTCPATCQLVTAMVCIASPGDECYETIENVCVPVPRPKCKFPIDDGNCWCDEQEPVGTYNCGGSRIRCTS